MKRYQIETIICLLLLIAIILLISISNTYAKYTTTVSGKSSTTVAKFKVSENTSQIFNLFETTYEEGGKEKGVLDTDVVQGKIAPGTEGRFAVEMINDSDVVVDYFLKFSISESVCNIPIEFSTDDMNYGKLISSFSTTGKLEIGDERVEPIYWRWLFDENDEKDTNLGLNPEEINVKAEIVFTQAN